MKIKLQDKPAKNVCSEVVRKDVCIGCGVCAGICPVQNLRMQWSPAGQLSPTDNGKCLSMCRLCLDACPFHENIETEDSLSAALYKDSQTIQHSAETGFYLDTYVGYANSRCRENGASGGVASWFLATLLEENLVDRVVCVHPKSDPSHLFEYAVLSTPEEVRGAAQSAYYPVEMSGIVRHIMGNEGRYAVIVLPCAAKALRLASRRFPVLKQRLAVVVGLVCGQTKSKYFTEYLVRRMGAEPSDVVGVSYRSKDYLRPASNFNLKVRTRSGEEATCERDGVYSETWCSGMFTPRACTLCDDIFAETADAAFMDAWLPEYISDSRGTSIVLVRSELARMLIKRGAESKAVVMEQLPIARVIASQRGVVLQKRTQLAQRLWMAKGREWNVPKRVAPLCPGVMQRLELFGKELLRKNSHKLVRVESRKSGITGAGFAESVDDPPWRGWLGMRLHVAVFSIPWKFSRLAKRLLAALGVMK